MKIFDFHGVASTDSVRHSRTESLVRETLKPRHFSENVSEKYKSLRSNSRKVKRGKIMATEKTERLELRLSSVEKEKIQKRARIANMTMSEYVLSLSDQKRIIVVDDIPKLVVEIVRIGTNINQIARVANSNKNIGKSYLERLQNDMADIQTKLTEIIKKLNAADDVKDN